MLSPHSASIFVKLQRLRRMLYELQFTMDKSSRVIYGNRLMEESAETIKWFVIAYGRKGNPIGQMNALEECIASFAVLRQDIDFCVETNIFHFAKRKARGGQELSLEESISGQKIELVELVAKADDEIGKWWTRMNKGTSPSD